MPLTARIDTRGVEKTQAGMLWMAGAMPAIADKHVGRFAKEETVRLEETPYPPELPNQRYVRTFELAGSWTAEPTTGPRWIIANEADQPVGIPYATLVVGPSERQAQIHKGRWWVAQEETASRLEEHLTKPLQEEVDSELRARLP
jgi:hypothetical protein